MDAREYLDMTENAVRHFYAGLDSCWKVYERALEHWEEDPHKVTASVFRQLVLTFWNNPLYDLAYDLGNPTIDIYANEILLSGLGWATYEKFRSELEYAYISA